MGTPHVIPEQYENVVPCDDDKPFSDGEECIECLFPSYFNFNTNLCEVCPSEYTFN